jgi:Arc/MetJ-type ribon-helix-helix transcriptional regulator
MEQTAANVPLRRIFMTILTVELPDSTYQFLSEQASSQGFGSPSEFLAALASQAEAHRDTIEQKLTKGLDSGPAREMSRQDWDELKRRVWDRHQAEQGS